MRTFEKNPEKGQDEALYVRGYVGLSVTEMAFGG
jgi:hypothetical protein